MIHLFTLYCHHTHAGTRNRSAAAVTAVRARITYGLFCLTFTQRSAQVCVYDALTPF